MSTTSYELLPIQFRRLPKGQVLVVNQAGEYEFLSARAFEQLLTRKPPLADAHLWDLESRQMVVTGDRRIPISMLATKLRSRRAFLKDFTALHMVVLTYRCTCRCDYCQASSTDADETGLDMSLDTAREVVDAIFRSPCPQIKIEFQGGEPTLNWAALEFIVKRARRVNRRRRKPSVEFVVCTNLMQLTDSMLRFVREHEIQISTSLDGPQSMHDLHRRRKDWSGSYDAFVSGLRNLRATCPDVDCSPLVTVTAQHLSKLREVIDEYVRLGFHGIFLRPVNPYGSAAEIWSQISCSVDDFLVAYKDALDYIIELNLGGYPFMEYYTTVLLTRILTPFSTGFVDLQSPTGGGTSGVIYDIDGSVYPSDEARMLARMGDPRFRLGSVIDDAYEDIFRGEKLRGLVTGSCVESMPGCASCAYQSYCGADPVRYYVESGDEVGHRPTSDFCRKHMGLFDHLFAMLRRRDESVLDVFWSWITRRPLEEVRACWSAGESPWV